MTIKALPELIPEVFKLLFNIVINDSVFSLRHFEPVFIILRNSLEPLIEHLDRSMDLIKLPAFKFVLVDPPPVILLFMLVNQLFQLKQLSFGVFLKRSSDLLHPQSLLFELLVDCLGVDFGVFLQLVDYSLVFCPGLLQVLRFAQRLHPVLLHFGAQVEHPLLNKGDCFLILNRRLLSDASDQFSQRRESLLQLPHESAFPSHVELLLLLHALQSHLVLLLLILLDVVLRTHTCSHLFRQFQTQCGNHPFQIRQVCLAFLLAHLLE